MVTIRITFTAGRYHATPWGSHVNEGRAEWPPSPWRFLRALTSTWKRTCPEVPPSDVGALLRALSSPPSFRLPSTRIGHSRHYMPLAKGTTLTFDAFIVLGRGDDRDSVDIVWPHVELNTGQRQLLERLVGPLPYLGRAESWCRASVVDGPQGECNAKPAEGTQPLSEYAPVLCAIDNILLRDLMVSTDDLRSGRRADAHTPPGSRWVTYATDSAITRSPTVDHNHGVARTNVIRFALVPAPTDSSPLPGITEALDVGDLARRAAMAKFGRRSEGVLSEQLSGRTENGPLDRQHQHCHYLATDEDGDGRLDHLTLWARAGLDQEEVTALCLLKELRQPEGAGRPMHVGLTLLGTGDRAVLPMALRGPSTVWRSETPFVLPRHPKVRGSSRDSETPQAQLLRELHYRGYGDKVTEVVAIDRFVSRSRNIPWTTFERQRHRQRPPVPGAFGFEITFSEQVCGPIAVGASAHFGLGLFRAVRKGGGSD